MSDTLIITKGINISMMIVDELDIFKFDNEDDFSWNDVFSRINTKNTRKKLIDGNYTWENLAKVMINKMKEFKTEYDNNSDKRKQKESTTSNDFYKSKVGYYLNINDRKKVNRASNKSTPLNNSSNLTRGINQPSNSKKKKRVLLQSNLR